MSSTETLTSLAMLKVNIDQGGDYLDYLKPFILQVLLDHKPDPVIDQEVVDFIDSQFGLVIPLPTIQIVLKRISKNTPLKRSDGVYHITGPLPDPGLFKKKEEADKHIKKIVSGLIAFARVEGYTLSDEEAVKAICMFLAEFNVDCLRAYLRSTAIPGLDRKQSRKIILVSEYVQHIKENNPEHFDSFLVVLQGHMLANALLCPDLLNAPKSYKNVTFYFDTPLLVHDFGLEGEPKKRAVIELITLLKNLGGNVAIFSHTYDELCRVLKAAPNYINNKNGRGAIVIEARKKGTTKSDLVLLANKVDDLIMNAGIEIKKTPSYITEFQIDELAFQQVLEDEIDYYNPKAKEYDINSVRSIYVLRAKSMNSSLENCNAVLVTSNIKLSRAASEYGKKHEETSKVSSVMTNFSLANLAWLKAPMGAPAVPKTELLSYVYAALQPSKEFLDKFLNEIDRLEAAGKISPRDHQLLRSDIGAVEGMMRITLGDKELLTEETITETLNRVSSEIKKEEQSIIRQEQDAHKITQKRLADAKAAHENIIQNLYWRCERRSRVWGGIISIPLLLILVIGGIFGLFGVKSSNPVLWWVISIFSFVGFGFTIFNWCFGTTLKKLHEKIQYWCLKYFFYRECKTIGIQMEVSSALIGSPPATWEAGLSYHG